MITNFTFNVKKSPDLVFEFLTDMQKFASVHPVISKIDRLSNQNYLVHETLKIGFIPFSFTYPVTIKENPVDLSVIILAQVFNITKIEMTFHLKPEGEYTLIEEQIDFKSPLPLKSIMSNIFQKQHTQLFKNIESI